MNFFDFEHCQVKGETSLAFDIFIIFLTNINTRSYSINSSLKFYTVLIINRLLHSVRDDVKCWKFKLSSLRRLLNLKRSQKL